MSAYSERLLALRKDMSMSKTPTKFSVGDFLGTTKLFYSSIYLYITLSLIVIILLLNIGIGAIQSVQKTKSKAPEWISTLVRIKDLTPKNQDKEWNTLRTEIKSVVSPNLSYIGMNLILDRDIDRVVAHAQQWYNAAEPLTDYSVNQKGVSFIGPGIRYFTDDLASFFVRAQELLPQTQKLINSLWYYQLAGYLTFNPKITTILKLLESSMDIARNLVNNKKDILELLGHTVRKTYLIFNQNNGESRPSGGFTGSFLTIDVSKGLLDIGDSRSIYSVDDIKQFPMVTHPIISQLSPSVYGKGFEGGLRNLNYFNCFPDTAKMYKREFASLKNQSFDTNGIVMLSTDLLQDLLPPNFVINVPQYGSFNSENIVNEINRITSAIPSQTDPVDVKASITPIFSIILQSLPRIVDQVGLNSMAKIILASLQSKNLQVWFDNEFVQSQLHAFGLDGSVTCGNNSVISPIQANITADKRDSITTNTYSISAKPTWGGYEVTLVYNQILPENNYLPRGFSSAYTRAFFGIQLPTNSWDINVSSSSIYNNKAVDDYYFLYLQDRYQIDYYTPPEFDTVYSSITDLNEGYTYLQPDGSKVAGTLFWTDQKKSDVTIRFKIPAVYLGSLMFVGQPGIHDPEVSLGVGLVQEDNPSRIIRNRFDIQKGLSLKLV